MLYILYTHCIHHQTNFLGIMINHCFLGCPMLGQLPYMFYFCMYGRTALTYESHANGLPVLTGDTAVRHGSPDCIYVNSDQQTHRNVLYKCTVSFLTRTHTHLYIYIYIYINVMSIYIYVYTYVITYIS